MQEMCDVVDNLPHNDAFQICARGLRQAPPSGPHIYDEYRYEEDKLLIALLELLLISTPNLQKLELLPYDLPS